MCERTENPNHPHYQNYGGRGIRVCKRWRESFAAFLEDMGERPPGTTLDRYPNRDGDYEPGNCRWATPKKQQNNIRTNRIITHEGRTMTLTQWALERGLTQHLLSQRLARGWTIERALETPNARVQ